MNIILGPPGTGKTTRLLTLVEEYLEMGISPDRIGYFSFTRKAAHEAIHRAAKRFSMSEKDLPYFRTLHSFAYLMLGVGRQSIMTRKHYDEVASWLKIGTFESQTEMNEGPFVDFGWGDKFLEIIDISRICMKPLREVYNYSSVPLRTDWARVDYVDRGLKAYKRDNLLYDYTDMIEAFIKRDLSPSFEVVFIDEVQDLSPLQWQMVHSIMRKARHVYIAGDDDQAIYRWAGADVDYFIRLNGNVEVLGQSYRIPALHHDISQRVIGRIADRRKKVFKPREEEGTVQWYRHSEEVDLSTGEWMLLSRTRRGVKQLEAEVRQRGFMYLINGKGSLDSAVLSAVRNWERLRSGENLRAKDIRNIYKQMIVGEEVAYGHKTLPDVDDDTLLNIEELTSDHGLLHVKPWTESMGRISTMDRNYLEMCLRHGDSFDFKPRITISTIHGSKGAESDNVLLLTDSVKRNNSLWKKNEYNEDDEARVFYVGLTRARRGLHLIHPMSSRGYDIPY